MIRATGKGIITLMLCLAVLLPGGARAALRELELPSGLHAVEARAFEGTASLERVVLPEGVLQIGSRAFAESSLREIVLPASLAYIAPDAFVGCGGLLAFVEPDSYAQSYCAEKGIATIFTGGVTTSPYKTDYSDVIWAALTREWGFTAVQAAGIMGNIYAECAYCPRNAQDIWYPGLDNGPGNADGSPVYVYDVNDGVGYGICQWTYPSRKQGLLDKALAMGTTVEDINAQLAFLKDELDSYGGVCFTEVIKSMTTVEEVCDLVLRDFESPVGWESRVELRRGYAREAYAMFAGT